MISQSYVKCAGNECRGGCGNAEHDFSWRNKLLREDPNDAPVHEVIALTGSNGFVSPVADAPSKSVYRTPHVREIKRAPGKPLKLYVARTVIVFTCAVMTTFVFGSVGLLAYAQGGWLGVLGVFGGIGCFALVMWAFFYLTEHG